jgi:hypothetical protein
VIVACLVHCANVLFAWRDASCSGNIDDAYGLPYIVPRLVFGRSQGSFEVVNGVKSFPVWPERACVKVLADICVMAEFL